MESDTSRDGIPNFADLPLGLQVTLSSPDPRDRGAARKRYSQRIRAECTVCPSTRFRVDRINPWCFGENLSNRRNTTLVYLVEIVIEEFEITGSDLILN